MTVYVPDLPPLTSVRITEAVREARMKRRGKIGPSENTFYWLADKYLNSPDFRALRRNSQILWGRELKFAMRDDILGRALLKVRRSWFSEGRRGDLEFEAAQDQQIAPHMIRGYINGWHDKPGKQRASLTALRALKAWALQQQLIQFSFTEDVRLKDHLSGHIPWEQEQVDLAIAHSRPDIARVIILGAYTGQRESDLVRLGWTDLRTRDGRDWIYVKQIKTGTEVFIPVFEPLAKAMATWERRPGPFLRNTEDNPWVPALLSGAWRRHRNSNPALAPIKDLVIHGLRGHACVRLYREGYTSKDVSRLVGMTVSTVEHYCKGASVENDSVAAVLRMENFRGTNLSGRKQIIE